MKLFGTVVGLLGIGSIAIGHFWPGFWSILIGITLVVVNSAMSET